jgi:hypothetical protein
MSGLYSKFKTNAKLEKDGIPVEYVQNSKGKPVTFIVARAGGANSEYESRLRAALKPYRRALQMETMEDSLLKKILKTVFIQTCIKDALNLEDENNEPLAFTEENVLKVLNDLPDIYDDLLDVSGKANVYRDQILEADAKN